jgi:hypothetical protein
MGTEGNKKEGERKMNCDQKAEVGGSDGMGYSLCLAWRQRRVVEEHHLSQSACRGEDTTVTDNEDSSRRMKMLSPCVEGRSSPKAALRPQTP